MAIQSVDINQVEKLKNRIWITRISRINAEKRLISKEKFIQAINIYYSCLTTILSIMSVVQDDEKLGIITVYMTVSLLVSIMYLNSQKYGEHAREFRENYTALQRLEFKLNHISGESNEIEEIEEEYCTLLNKYNNHITYDFYYTLYNSSPDFQINHGWNKTKALKYRWGCIWRFLVKLVVVLLPIFLYFIRGEI